MTISIFNMPMGWAVYCDGVKIGGLFRSKAAAFEAAILAASCAVQGGLASRLTYRTRRVQTVYRASGLRRSSNEVRIDRSMPANSTKAWSTEDDERLKALLEKGTHPSLVAAKSRRTANAVLGRASKIGISLRQIKLGLKAKK